MSNEVIKTPDNMLVPELVDSGKGMYVKSCLKQDRITFNHGKIVNIYIVFALKSTLNYDEDITLENCLFVAVKLTKIADISSTNILDVVLDLMEKELFHTQVVDLVTM